MSRGFLERGFMSGGFALGDFVLEPKSAIFLSYISDPSVKLNMLLAENYEAQTEMGKNIYI